MKIWKKNLVAAAVLVTVCAGIYVNWLYSNKEASLNLEETIDASKLVQEDAVSVSSEDNVSSDYFAAVRLSRQQARDSAVSLLQEAMAYSDDTQTSQQNAQLEDLVQTALCEAQIESLVIAKGYVDCVAYIGEDGISVAVASPEGGLQQKDVAVIAYVVISQSDYSMNDIRVVEVQ